MSKITEPVTMITDYILAVYCFYLANRIFVYSTSISAKFMAFTLIFTGIGAFVGGTSHGYKEYLGEKLNNIVWKSTLYTLGISSLLFIVSAVISSITSEFIGYTFISMGVIVFLIYAYWMIDHSEFKYVIIDYGSALILVILLKTISYYRFSDPSSLWIIAGIIITIIASLIQAFGVSIHDKYFNHNDLFHIIQLPGIYMLYRGAIVMKDFI